MKQRTAADAFACSLNDDEFRQRRRLIREELLPHVTRIEKPAGGLRVTFPETSDLRAAVETFVGLERQCCGFLSFTIAPPGEGLILTIEGPPEARGTLDMFAAAIGDA